MFYWRCEKGIASKTDKEIIGITYDRKLPNPGVTGVKFHTFTLLRGVLRRRQPRLEPHRFQKSRALLPTKTWTPVPTYVDRSYGSITDTFPNKIRP